MGKKKNYLINHLYKHLSVSHLNSSSGQTRSCSELWRMTESNSISNVRTKQHLNIMGSWLTKTTKCKKISISPAKLDYVLFCLYLKLPAGRTLYVCAYVCPYRGNLKWGGLTLALYFGEPGSSLYSAFDLGCVCAGQPAVPPSPFFLRTSLHGTTLYTFISVL